MKRLILIAVILLLSSSTALAQSFCKGDHDFDGDCDATDVASFLVDFGRSPFNNPCPPDGPAPVAKTGRTTSYATGDDGELKKGVASPNPRFTDNGDGTITDNLTGLIWLKNANCFGELTWQNAIGFANGLSDGECGLSDGSNNFDWRLPNFKELHSLVHYGFSNPSLSNTTGRDKWSEDDPFNNVVSNWYWSSTSASADYAWFVSMSNATWDYAYKAEVIYVWPVRGGR
jgi:hypothetical protein